MTRYTLLHCFMDRLRYTYPKEVPVELKSFLKSVDHIDTLGFKEIARALRELVESKKNLSSSGSSVPGPQNDLEPHSKLDPFDLHWSDVFKTINQASIYSRFNNSKAPPDEFKDLSDMSYLIRDDTLCTQCHKGSLFASLFFSHYQKMHAKNVSVSRASNKQSVTPELIFS